MLRLLKSIALLMIIASPSHAFDMTDMTDAERDAFRSEVRNYLLEYPDLIIEVITVLENRSAQATRDAEVDMIFQYSEELFDDGYSFVGGNPEGDLTIVEFLDYRCGYCRKAHPEIAELLAKDGNIRFIVKELPILGEASVIASRFAIATRRLFGSDAYEAMHDALMTMQGNPSAPVLSRIAESLELDGEAILEEMTSEAVTNEINRNRTLAGRMAIDGTPTFVVDTQMLRGYVPLDQLTQIVASIRE